MRFGLLVVLAPLLFLFSFSNCKEKEVVKKLGRVSGRLLDSCTGLPQAGVELQFWQNFQVTQSIFQKDIPAELLVIFKTDANGNFNFEMPRSVSYGSIRYFTGSVSFFLADGNFGLNNFEGTLNIGNLYRRSDSKLTVLQFKNDRKFEAGDKIIMGYSNPITEEMQWDTITGPLETVWQIEKRMYFSGKQLEMGIPVDVSKLFQNFFISWKFAKRNDKSTNPIIFSTQCSQAVDTFQFIHW